MWHHRLGHIGKDAILRSVDITNGMNIDAQKSEPKICPGCQTGRAPRNRFTASDSRATRPLELVVADIAGPIRTPGIDGARYFFLIMDDYSRYVKIYIMTRKNDAIACFKQFKALCDTHLKGNTHLNTSY